MSKQSKPSLPSWCKVGAAVLVRSSAYGSRIAASAQHATITELLPSGLFYVRTRLDAERVAEGGLKDSPRVRAVRFRLNDEGDGAFEYDPGNARRRSLLPATPTNRAKWSEEMREHSRRMTEQRRRDREQERAKAAERALWAGRRAAFERLVGYAQNAPPTSEAMIDDEIEVIAFIRGILRSADNE